MLTLRSGLGGGRPQTRERVARTLDLSAQRVGRLERRGIRRLRGLRLAGRCGGGTVAADQTTLGPAAGTLDPADARVLKAVSWTSSDRVEVKSERKSSRGTKVKPAPDDAQPLNPPPAAAIVDRGGADLTLPLLGLVLLAGLLIAARAVRRSRGV